MPVVETTRCKKTAAIETFRVPVKCKMVALPGRELHTAMFLSRRDADGSFQNLHSVVCTAFITLLSDKFSRPMAAIIACNASRRGE